MATINNPDPTRNVDLFSDIAKLRLPQQYRITWRMRILAKLKWNLWCRPRNWLTARAYTRWGYPPALEKACFDYFDYAAGLSDGTTLRFAQARAINRDWVHFQEITEVEPNGHNFCFDRGLDVRVDQVAWVADAPHGS